MKCLRRPRITFFLLVVSITLSGCTPEKARSLQIAVVQFKAESIAAIKAIEETHQRELTTLSLSQIELRNNVINTSGNPKIQSFCLRAKSLTNPIYQQLLSRGLHPTRY